MVSCFGTDGIRGRANTYPIDPETLLRIGLAVGSFFRSKNNHKRVVIGKDTRLSGYMIENALVSGLTATGMDVFLLGPIPTPAVALLVKSMRADIGIMVSASHNSFQDNGVKFFNSDGYKLQTDQEKILELHMSSFSRRDLSEPTQVGRARRIDDAQARYIEYVKNILPKNCSLEGMRVVIDCANGATYKIAPTVLWELGADVIPISIQPDGLNINKKCGSTSPESLVQTVLKNRAHIGIALDGDGDRLVIVDEKGRLIQADQLIAFIADIHLKKHMFAKDNPSVVGTILSNLGLEHYLKNRGINFLRTRVGDRHVSALMRSGNHQIGGEPSGHVIFGDYGTTGDGLMTALFILAYLKIENKPASKLSVFKPVPQAMCNVACAKNEVPNDHVLEKIVDYLQPMLENKGRLIIRRSGTESMIRIMGECENATTLEKIMNNARDALYNLTVAPMWPHLQKLGE